jgi:hypothetical protein
LLNVVLVVFVPVVAAVVVAVAAAAVVLECVWFVSIKLYIFI